MSKTEKIVIAAFVSVAVGLWLFVVFACINIQIKQRTIKKANEASAVANLRLLNTAETQYNFMNPEHGYSCSLMGLSGKMASDTTIPDATPALGIESKSGYTFSVSNCTMTSFDKQGKVISYQIAAVPLVRGESGDRGLCINEMGVIKSDPKGGTNCTQALQETQQ